jgi:protein-disulfide isomerase
VNKKAWIIFVGVCFVLFGGLVVLARKDAVNVSSVDQSSIVAASAGNGNIADHVFGNKSGKTILIEYGDFQCPACGAAYPTLKTETEKYKDKLTFIFRNNPLTTIHPNARAGAAAAEAAGLQGKYWEMHNTLYENQNDWSTASFDKRTDFFVTYAKDVGVKDINKFKADLESKNVNSKIDFDLALGKKIPVQGTPTILLDGKQIDSTVWSDQGKFDSVIADALK